MIHFLKARRQRKALRKIEAMRCPDYGFWSRRLAQFDSERRTRALLNAGVYSPELWR